MLHIIRASWASRILVKCFLFIGFCLFQEEAELACILLDMEERERGMEG